MIKKIAIAIIIFVIVVFAIVGIATSGSSPSSTPAEEPQAAQAVEPETQASITIAEQDYLTSTGKISGTLSNTLTEFGSLAQDYHIGDDAWTLQVAAQLVIIRGEYEKTASLVPPDSLTDVHTKFYLGMSCFNEMTYIFTEGVDSMDPDLINEATVKMDEGTGYILEAVDLMNDFNAAHGL